MDNTKRTTRRGAQQQAKFSLRGQGRCMISLCDVKLRRYLESSEPPLVLAVVPRSHGPLIMYPQHLERATSRLVPPSWASFPRLSPFRPGMPATSHFHLDGSSALISIS